MQMKMLKLVMNMALAAMFLQLTTATEHTVGSPTGSWDTLTDLQTWAASNKLMVGDTLSFQYSPMHDVLEVSKTDYESCMPSSPIMTGTTGSTTVALKAPGKRYFICGVPGHCEMGMKMEVVVNPATKAAVPSPPSLSTPSTPPPSSMPKTPSSMVSTPPPNSAFAPKKTPSSKVTASPPPSSSMAPEPSSNNTLKPTLTPKASPYVSPTRPVGSQALATKSSSTMKEGFNPAVAIAIALALSAVLGF